MPAETTNPLPKRLYVDGPMQGIGTKVAELRDGERLLIAEVASAISGEDAMALGRALAHRYNAYPAAEAERDGFASLMEMPDGPDGEPAGRATPSNLRAYIAELHSEWDDAEKRETKAKAKHSALVAALRECEIALERQGCPENYPERRRARAVLRDAGAAS